MNLVRQHTPADETQRMMKLMDQLRQTWGVVCVGES